MMETTTDGAANDELERDVRRLLPDGATVDLDTEVLESHRPALEKLAKDVKTLEEELFDGFQSRHRVLFWLNRAAVRTLGQADDDWYRKFASAFRGTPGSDLERTTLSALLTDDARRRDLDADAVEGVRRKVSSVVLRPSFHHALRELRSDATEYADDAEGSTSTHSPEKQRYIAMRPALDELEERQSRALARCILGFSDDDAIAKWTGDVEVASHGEIHEDWSEKVQDQRPVRRMLKSDETHDRRARELFAAYYLVPVFNAGARDLYGRSKELPDSETESREAPDW